MKSLSIYLGCCLCLNCFLFPVNSQFFSSGTDPFSTKWKQINTENLQIIYPENFYEQANKLAGFLDQYGANIGKSLNSKQKKISIVMHNQSVLSNGYVTWAPKRMELIAIPPTDNTAQDWLYHFALHEYRHVLQINKLNNGFSKILTCLIGQAGIGISAAQVPIWFIEGDAVLTETLLSNNGRGRLASFEMPINALLLENKKTMSYDKFLFGSYKNYFPDYYRVGYQIVAYSRLKYGKMFWEKSLNHVAKYPYLPYSLNIAFHSQYKTSITKLYSETIDTLKVICGKRQSNLELSSYYLLNTPSTNNYTNYRFPHYLANNVLLALKTSIDDLNKIVMIDSFGHETALHVPGQTYDDWLSANTNLITWSEIITDKRWEQRNYSVIKTYNLNSGKINQLSRKSRYFFPVLSKTNNKIAAIEIDLTAISSIVVLDAETGSIIQKFSPPRNELLQYPFWYNDSTIVTIAITDQGKYIYSVDQHTKKWEILYGPTFENISQLCKWKNYILYRGGYNGIENIYALNKSNKEIYQITNTKFGAFDPFVYTEKNYLFYSNYTVNGFRLVKSKLQFSHLIPIKEVKVYKTGWPEKLLSQESVNSQHNKPIDKNYSSKPYYRFLNLFNFHSWAPIYINPSFDDPSDIKINPGFIILSQNKLSTFISSIGLSYENNTFKFRPTFTYNGFYPVINFSAEIGGSIKKFSFPENVTPQDTLFPYTKFSFNTYIPLNLSNGKYRNFLRPEFLIDYENILYYSGGIKRGISQFHYKLLYYRYLSLSKRDIYPKWGQLIALSLTDSPFEDTQYGYLYSASGFLFFPGLFKHHSLRIYGGIQIQKPKRLFYSFNRVTLPRGYLHVIDAYAAKNIKKVTADYSFPILYPDLSIGSLMYIKRLRTNLFGDFAKGENVIEISSSGRATYSRNYYSFGVDLLSDFHLFRFFFPFTSGMRYIFLPSYNSGYFGFLFSIDTSVF